MLTLPLKLIPCATARRKPRAWLITGEEPAAWFAEIAHWPVPSHQLAFHLLRDPVTDKIAGALVAPDVALDLPPGRRAQAYGEIIPGFFVPVHSLLSPAVDDRELKSLCLHAVSVFHPVYGLVGFETHEIKRAADLLLPPPINPENWSAARSPAPPWVPLRFVRLMASLSFTEIFGEESKEIGSEPITELPPTPQESAGTLPGKIGSGISSALVKALLGLTALAPRRVGIAPTWINHLESWAQSKLSGMTEKLDFMRNKELHRLLEMLEKDPEEGLKHAISLAQLAHRGKAPPSSRLGQRPTDFNLSRLGGGHAADGWNISANIQNNLATLYRNNAQRETKLGRHRRAAYIYAELLGDFAAAADVLKQGRFFREAALLYQERLNKPLLAAECLSEGGFHHEAIEIFEKHERWLEAASLYEKLGNQERAEATLRRAVAVHLKSDDILAAAQLLETRLHVPEEALALLTAAWPDGKQAMPCLRERIALLTRLQRRDALLQLVTTLAQQTCAPRHLVELVGLLVHTAKNTADGSLRQAAADAVQIKVSVALTLGNLESSGETAVLRALTQLAPQDRLLGRDTSRFRNRRQPPVPARLPAPSTQFIRKYVLEKGQTLHLPKVGTWMQIRGGMAHFQAVARRDNQHLFFTRASWRGAQQSADWTDPSPQMKTSLIFSAGSQATVLGRPFAPGLKISILPATEAFGNISCMVGTPEWLPEDTIQTSEAKGICWGVRVVGSRIVVASFQAGKQLYSRDVTEDLTSAGATGGGTALLIDATGARGRVALAYGDCLLVMNDGKPLQAIKHESRIVGLIPGDEVLPGWFVILERGTVFVDAHTMTAATVEESLPAALSASLGDGRMILVAEGEGKVFQRYTGKWHHIGFFSLPKMANPIIGISPTDFPQEFAVIDEKGEVQRWKVPI